MAEHLTVAQEVAGSNPVSHPTPDLRRIKSLISLENQRDLGVRILVGPITGYY